MHLQAQNNEDFLAALDFFPNILCDTSPFLLGQRKKKEE